MGELIRICCWPKYKVESSASLFALSQPSQARESASGAREMCILFFRFIGANLGCRGLLSAALGLRLWAPADTHGSARGEWGWGCCSIISAINLSAWRLVTLFQRARIRRRTQRESRCTCCLRINGLQSNRCRIIHTRPPTDWIAPKWFVGTHPFSPPRTRANTQQVHLSVCVRVYVDLVGQFEWWIRPHSKSPFQLQFGIWTHQRHLSTCFSHLYHRRRNCPMRWYWKFPLGVPFVPLWPGISVVENKLRTLDVASVGLFTRNTTNGVKRRKDTLSSVANTILTHSSQASRKCGN